MNEPQELRDLFAAHALAAMAGDKASAGNRARFAYEIADKMLVERAREPQPDKRVKTAS